MNNRPQFFYATGDCGCEPAYPSTPCPPNSKAMIADDRYYALATSPNGQILVIPPGSNTHAFLKAPNGGFVMVDANGNATVVSSPSAALPIHNPAVANVFPVPTAFDSIMVGVGTNPPAWKFLHAPSTGTHLVQAENGTFGLVPAGQIPGLNQVFLNSASATGVEIFGFIQTGQDGDGNPIIQARKLTATGTADLPLVLRLNPTTGRYEVTTVTAGDRNNLPDLGVRKIVGLDTNGNPINNGFEVRGNSGSLTDFDLLMYDKVNGILLRAPAAAFQRKATPGVTSNIPNGSPYIAVTDGRLTMHVACNYGRALVTWNTGVKDADDENGVNLSARFKLRVDDVDYAEYAMGSSKSQARTDIVTGLSPGVHKFEVVVANPPTGTGALVLRDTFMAVQELIF